MLPVCRENGVEIVGRSLSESKKAMSDKISDMAFTVFQSVGGEWVILCLSVH